MIKNSWAQKQTACLPAEPQQAQDPGLIMNTAHINAALQTIKYALENGAKPFLLSTHLGQPNGKKKNKKFFMAPVANAVEEKIGRPVQVIKGAKNLGGLAPSASLLCPDIDPKASSP